MVAIVTESPFCCAASITSPVTEVADVTREETPSTVASDSDYQEKADVGFEGVEQSATAPCEACPSEPMEEMDVPRQLGPGLYHEDAETLHSSVPRQLQAGPPTQEDDGEDIAKGIVEDDAPRELQTSHSVQAGASEGDAPGCAEEQAAAEEEAAPAVPFTRDETLFIFDWDDTILPSSFLQQHGLRLDESSQPTAEQREVLAEVAAAAARTLSAARWHGTVVLVTNAERGWIELSCLKFLPTLYPLIEGVKIVSARTTYESPQCLAPLQWKLRAFAVEITDHFGSDVLADPSARKNALSLGDSLHEREALLMATNSLPNCCTKALKFVERPDISQLCKQHELVADCFERILHHDDNLDLCIRCP